MRSIRFLLSPYPATDIRPLPCISLGNMDRRCCGLGSHAVVKDLLHAPLHRIVFTRAQSGSRSLFKSHLLTQEPPPGSFRQTEHGFDVTSPEFTLLNLATQVSRNQLLMACYEMCSSLLCIHPANERNGNLMKLFRLSSFHPTAAGSGLSTSTARIPTCGSARRFFPQRISPRSPSRPQACAVLSSSAGPPNA